MENLTKQIFHPVKWCKCTLYMFHGGHFFINDCVEDVVSVINEIVNQLYYM